MYGRTAKIDATSYNAIPCFVPSQPRETPPRITESKMFALASPLWQDTSPIFHAMLVLVFCFLVFLLGRETCSALRSIPGPFPARFSRLWMAWHSWSGNMHRMSLGKATWKPLMTMSSRYQDRIAP